MKTIVKTALLDSSQRVLLLKRSVEDDDRPGGWDFPGGGVHEGEDLLHAAAREILEEAGLDIPMNKLKLVYAGTDFSTAKQNSQNRPLFIAHVGDVQKVKLSFEHEMYQWYSIDEAISLWSHPFWPVGLKYAVDHNLLP